MKDGEWQAWHDRARHAIQEIVGHSFDHEVWPDDALPLGTRVRVVKDPNWDGPWRQEFEGAIDDLRPPRLVEHKMANLGEYEYFVRFDEPQMDDTDLGPYPMAEIWDRYLVPLQSLDDREG